MQQFFRWFFSQRKIVRYCLSASITLLVGAGIFVPVNLFTGEPWYSGLAGIVVVALLGAGWSLSDKEFYEEREKKTRDET